MRIVLFYAAASLLCLAPTCYTQQAGAPRVHLTVVHNGRSVPTPHQMQMGFCGQWATVRIRDEYFSVPVDSLRCPTVSLRVRIRGHLLQPSGIPNDRLRDGHRWKVLFAEKSYGGQYDGLLPGSLDIKSTCIITFDPREGESTLMIDPSCRVQRAEAEPHS